MNEAAALAGFVLVGGRSFRMGSDKALLECDGTPLASRVAGQLKQVAEEVTLVGDAARYGHLGFPVVPDHAVGRGPLSGIEAALDSEFAREWNLIVACDMPLLHAGLFAELRQKVLQASPETDCIVPMTSGKLQPLCAVYRHRCGTVVSGALQGGTRRVVDAVQMLQAEVWPTEDAQMFQNVNTRPEWLQFLLDWQAAQLNER